MSSKPLPALWIGVCLAASAAAQTPYGNLGGRVLDTAGARVPNADITATNLSTNVQTKTASNSEGNYQLRALLPGRYRVEVRMDGFKTFMREPIEVRVGDALNLEVVLEVGTLTENVTVTSEAPLLESSTASLGQVIDARRISDLPRGGDSVLYLLQLSVGAYARVGSTALWPTSDRGNTGSFSIAGARRGWSVFSIDGNPINDSASTTLNPNPDMIQEIRIQTNAVDASVGRFTGAHMNMMMKTGTNALHGSAGYTFFNRDLMAMNFFTKRSIHDLSSGPVTDEKIDRFFPKQHIKRFRPNAGGPVYLPKLYDGRNRTFWTFGVDIERVVMTRPVLATVPTEKQRRGDFSDTLALGSQYQLYDPWTARPAAGGRFQRDPLPGNLVPASRISSMAREFLPFWPMPNVQGTADGRDNYADPVAAPQPVASLMGRFDHEISPRNRFYGSATWMRQNSSGSDSFHTGGTGSILNRNQRGLTLSDVVTLRPDLVLDLRATLTRYSEKWPPPTRGFDLAKLGLPASLVGKLDPNETVLPTITTGDFQAIPDSNRGRGLEYMPITYYSWTAQAVHQRGNHGLRFGGEYRVLQRNRYATDNISPQYTFSTTWMRGPLDTSAAPTLGAGFASFLQGLPSSGFIDRVPTFAQTSKYASFHFQDDWKITRKLTLNLGLRYEVNLPITERYNRTVRGFDFEAANPVQDAARAAYAANPIAEVAASAFRVLGGLRFAGVDRVPRNLWDTDGNNVSPRIGLAYLLRPSTVVRASYGIFFQPMGADRERVVQSGFEMRTNMVPTMDNGQTFRATLENPFPDGILEPRGASAGLRTYLGQAISFFSPQMREPYLQRWAFNIQQGLPHRMALDVGYVGSRAVGLGIAEQFNAVPAGYLSTSPVRDQATIDYLSRTVSNPFYGLAEFEGTSLSTPTVARSRLLTPYPHFSDISATRNSGSSAYHSLQARLEKRFSYGWTLQAAYTWSKLLQAVSRLNPTDPRPERVVSDDDRPHNLVVSGVYEFPFGRGRRWLGGRGWQDRLFGGWSLQALYTAISGEAIAWGNVGFYGNVKDIPLSGSARGVDRWFNTDAGFERASARQLASNIRTFPSRLSGLRAYGTNCLNASLYKALALTEQIKVQVEFEVADVFNTPQWGSPNTSPTNSLFGRISSVQEGMQRWATIGAKVTW